MEKFKINTRVKHPLFCEGTIIKTETSKLQVEFDNQNFKAWFFETKSNDYMKINELAILGVQ